MLLCARGGGGRCSLDKEVAVYFVYVWKQFKPTPPQKSQQFPIGRIAGNIIILIVTMRFLLLAFVLGLAAEFADALRFAHNPVSVDTEVLIVGRPARLTCNYVKYRTESVREISWFIGYAGGKIRHKLLCSK